MNLKIIMAQLNACVGDVAGNLQLAIDAIAQAKAQHADIIVFPECFLSGYPADDLLYRDNFLQQIENALATLAHHCDTILCLIGHPQRHDSILYNCASFLYENKCLATYYKQHLPNHCVFDEKRYFTSGNDNCIIDFKGYRIASLICEDIWHQAPLRKLEKEHVDLILVANASPFSLTQHEERQAIINQHNDIPLIYVNLVGGQDDVVFDGGSMAIWQHKVCVQAPFFKEALTLVQFADDQFKMQPLPPLPQNIAQVYNALVLGVKDYVHKNGFKNVLIGLSGGIDSALTLAIAADALGKEHVRAIGMPSRYTSQLSLDLAQQQVDTMKVAYQLYSIDECYAEFLNLLQSELAHDTSSLAHQNCQSRCRGNILMTLANAHNALVLNTGNRSELAMGYATLYGDMVGAFSVLKDVSKTLVYELAHYCNRDQEIIPQAVIERPPSAELAPNQKDEDNLPPYDILDNILNLYINKELDAKAIVARGFNAKTVERVIQLLYRNEYKRRQSAPGVRLFAKAFGRARRYPITQRYHEKN